MDMNLFVLLSSTLFGVCCGSFFNVCIYRIPRQGLQINHPAHSFCPHCFTSLNWYENIPLISYFFQKGQCRHCLVWISPRYPLVEILTSLLFVFVAWKTALSPISDWSLFGAQILFISSLIVCTFIDIDLRIIPDEIDKPGMVIFPILSIFVPQIFLSRDLLSLPFTSLKFFQALPFRAFLTSIVGVMVGAGLIFLIGVIGKIMFKKEAMGFGDVKFMGMIGGFIGYKSVLLAFLLACFMGAFIGGFKKFFTKDSYIPFGPYLALGSFFSLYYRSPIMKFILEDYPFWLKNILH